MSASLSSSSAPCWFTTAFYSEKRLSPGTAKPLSPGWLEPQEAQIRAVRLRGKDGILGGDLGHDHHGRYRPGDLVQDRCDRISATLGRGCLAHDSLLRGDPGLPGHRRLALLPRHVR